MRRTVGVGGGGEVWFFFFQAEDGIRDYDVTGVQTCAVFWAWIGQLLEENASCSRGLSLIQAWCAGAGIEPPAGDTSSYCQARMRVGEEFLKKILTRIDQWQRHAMRPEDRWNGLVLKAFDGTSVKLMDTVENQEMYPQPSSQAEGCEIGRASCRERV